MLDFWRYKFLNLETYGLHHFLNRFVIFNKNFLVPMDHFSKENLILLICRFFFNIRHTITRKIFSFTGCSRNFKKLYSNAPMEHFARDTGVLKWHPRLPNNLAWNSPFSTYIHRYIHEYTHIHTYTEFFFFNFYTIQNSQNCKTISASQITQTRIQGLEDENWVKAGQRKGSFKKEGEVKYPRWTIIYKASSRRSSTKFQNLKTILTEAMEETSKFLVTTAGE